MSTPPAVSVIIPLYNAARYVADALESLLAQSLKNFEVIVVDDCSTDNSVAVVESYRERFGGRLKIFSMPTNSGNGGLPRNKGIKLSRGEYVFFVDADDLITPTALEELYAPAKNFDADVVYIERHFEACADLSEIYIAAPPHKNLVTAPTLESDDLSERVRALIAERFTLATWSKFVRRDLLIDREIFFPHVKVSEDDIWTYALIFHARRLLRVPNVVYVWRLSENSSLRTERTPRQTLTLWLDPLVRGIKILDDFMGGLEFFRRNVQYRCAVLEFFAHTKMARVYGSSLQLPLHEIYTAVNETFGKSSDGQGVLISWLLTDLIAQQKIFVANQRPNGE
ncbi:MAG: glycosyltransferase [Quinella sp. 2Q5]|nr:glycosyltransferase [Quinella sp. 2Q5]